MAKSQGYIASLLKPRVGKDTDRRVWSLPLQGVWLPFFTATNTAGDTAIPAEVLGAPLRLAKAKDGTPRFSANGRPMLRVVKELGEHIRIVRENFTAGLLAYAEAVIKANPAGYKAQVQAAQKAAKPLMEKDAADVQAYLDRVEEETAAKAQAVAEAEAAVKSPAPADAPTEPTELETVPA